MHDHVGEQLGNYRVLRLLGRGGSASVYLGEHVYLKSQAALKVLHTQLTDQEATRFVTEAQTLALNEHAIGGSANGRDGTLPGSRAGTRQAAAGQ